MVDHMRDSSLPFLRSTFPASLFSSVPPERGHHRLPTGIRSGLLAKYKGGARPVRLTQRSFDAFKE